MYREMHIEVKTMFQEILCALDTDVMLRSVNKHFTQFCVVWQNLECAGKCMVLFLIGHEHIS